MDGAVQGLAFGKGFVLEVEPSYDGVTLTPDFTLGGPEPSAWTTFLVLFTPDVELIPAWTVVLPAIDPLLELPVEFPLPNLGVIGVWSGLITAEGVVVSDFDVVDTGP